MPGAWNETQTAFLTKFPNGNLEWLAQQTEHSVGAVKAKLHNLRTDGVIKEPRIAYVAPPKPPPAPKPVISAPEPATVFRPISRTGLMCQWFEGNNPRTWRQCEHHATHGRHESSWCDAHRARVFVRRGHEVEAA